MPEGVVYVGRPSMWGNPFDKGDPLTLPKYEQFVKDSLYLQPHFLNPPRGKDLACWCPVSSPCHADVLLRLANS